MIPLCDKKQKAANIWYDDYGSFYCSRQRCGEELRDAAYHAVRDRMLVVSQGLDGIDVDRVDHPKTSGQSPILERGWCERQSFHGFLRQDSPQHLSVPHKTLRNLVVALRSINSRAPRTFYRIRYKQVAVPETMMRLQSHKPMKLKSRKSWGCQALDYLDT